MGNCVAPAADHGNNGRDEQMPRDKSDGEETNDLGSPKSVISCEKTGNGVVRVKLVISKKELAELLANGLTQKKAMEDLLVKNCGTAAPMSMSHCGWRPSLESIPEDKNNNKGLEMELMY